MRTFSWQLAAVVVVLAVNSVAVAQDQMHWQPNLETAQRVAGQSNRLVLVHFWAPWCQPCMKLEQTVFGKPETGRSLEANFVCVKVNVDEFPSTTRLYGVSSLPTDVVITPTGRLVSSTGSPSTSAQYITQMNQIAAGHRQLNQQTYAQASAPAPGSTQQRQLHSQTPAQQQPIVQSPIQGQIAQQQIAQAPTSQPPYQAQAQPSTTINAAAQPAAETSDDRYADYYKSRAQQPAAEYGQPAGPPNGVAAPAQPYVAPSQPNTAVASRPNSPPAGQAGQQQPPINAQIAAKPAIQLPPGTPPVGLDGNCPVTLTEQKRWVPGIPRFGAVHRGRTYLFTGEQEQKKFLANPDYFSPVISGNDPVLALDSRQSVPGKREHGVFYNNRIYLFSGEASLQQFNSNAARYEAQVLSAMQPTGTQVR